MRFLIDENLPFSLVRRLTELGHDVEHASAINLRAVSDEKICAYAEEAGAAIVSKDSDFTRLSARDSPRIQVVLIKIGNSRNVALWRMIVAKLPEIEAGLAAGERLIEVE